MSKNNDLISREALKETINEKFCKGDIEETAEAFNQGLNVACLLIDNAPAVGTKGYSFCPYCGADLRKGGA